MLETFFSYNEFDIPITFAYNQYKKLDFANAFVYFSAKKVLNTFLSLHFMNIILFGIGFLQRK